MTHSVSIHPVWSASISERPEGEIEEEGIREGVGRCEDDIHCRCRGEGETLHSVGFPLLPWQQ